MNKTYLSASIAGHLDIPIGDPFGGPAYGERNMPFIVGPSVAAAATAIGAAAAAGTAAAVGAAAMATVSAIAAVATVAGVAMTVVGAITGDKDLMKIGAMVGIAGGVTGLATGAFGAGTAAASEAATAGDVAASSTVPLGTTTAHGGLLGGGTTAMSNAITPAFSSVSTQAMSATPALTATAGESALSTLGTVGQVGSLGSAAYKAVAPSSSGTSASAPSTYIPPDSLANAGANAPSMPVTIGASAPDAPNIGGNEKTEGSYFDELMSPKNMASLTGPALVGIGTGVIQGMGKDTQADYQNKLVNINQSELDLKKMQDERDYANANTQGYNGMTTRPLTQQEYDQAKLNKARLATQQAGLLTQSA